MTPDELEQHSRLMMDFSLEHERQPSFCSKISYFFFKQEIPSHLETYLNIKKEHGADGDYSCIDNEAILLQYGIIFPERLDNPVSRGE